MIMEKKFVWEVLSELLDPFAIAAASLTARKVRAVCVSPSGRLIVPYLDYDPDRRYAEKLMQALPTIEIGEVICISVSFLRSHKNQQQKPDPSTFFLGWLLGPCVKLREVSIYSVFDGPDHDGRLFAPLLQHWARSCPCLEVLRFFSAHPEDIVKALPAFKNLLTLDMYISSAKHNISAADILDSIADCSAVSLRNLLLGVHSDTEDITQSLQRCLHAFPLSFVELYDADEWPMIGILPGKLGRISWPRTCHTVHVACQGEDQFPLAKQICLSNVRQLVVQVSGDSLMAADVDNFLEALTCSQLEQIRLELPMEADEIPADVLKAIRAGAVTLIQKLPSLHHLLVLDLHDRSFLRGLTRLAKRHGVSLRKPPNLIPLF